MQLFVSMDVSKRAVTGRLLLNKIFGIPTLGFYRFWGKTHLRRLLWQSIKINEDRLQYHGTAKELFIGFLIGIVIMAVLFGMLGIVLSILSLMNPIVGFFSQFINILVLYCFWQFALYRLWRYRLSRTSLRAIRFYLKGKALTYMGRVLLWSFLSILTLGWAYPKLLAVKSNYMLNNVAFGDQGFQYSGQTSEFYNIYWPVILLYQCFAVGIFTQVALTVDFSDVTADNFAETIYPSLASTELHIAIGVGSILLFFMFLWARIQSFRYIIGSLQFAEARFVSSLRMRNVVGIFAIMALVGLLGYAILAGLFFGVFLSSADNPGLAIGFGIGGFLILYLVIDLLMYLFLFIPLLKVLTKSLSTDNILVFEQVATTSVDSPKYGEGLADALDVGAF